MKEKEPHINASVNLKSTLTIEEVGKLIGDKVFSGAVFGGKEDYIYEEVPAVYIAGLMLGFLVVIQGWPVSETEPEGYFLEMVPYFGIHSTEGFKDVEFYEVSLDNYLFALLQERLTDHPEIQVVKPERSID